MMTVVILIGILATLAVYGVRKYIMASKTGEATAMMTTIKSAEEAFKGETFVYLDVSSDFAAESNWYPTWPSGGGPGTTKVQWGGGTSTAAKNWATLGVQPDGPVLFEYACVAVAPGSNIPTLPTDLGKSNSAFGLSGAASQWTYVALARADLDGSGDNDTYVMSHSLTNEVYIKQE